MEVQLRSPKEIMKLSRLGCFHQSKLSFLRSFLEEFKDWKYSRDLFELNKEGYGRAVYSFSKNNRTYSLICFANELKDNERSDRVIATKWDAAFVLYDGIPNKLDIERLNENVPKQEVGRLSYKELTLSRANRSVRLFNEVVESLSNGRQPDKNILSKVGLKTLTNNYQSYSASSERKLFNLNKSGTIKILPLICYEIIYSGKLSLNNNYNFIVNISEDGWFGNSIGPSQHFAHSIFRSVEYGKYTLRSANNGISAIVDPSGKIINMLNTNNEGVISIKKMVKTNKTLFSTYGNKIYFLVILLYIFLIFSFKKLRNE